MTKIPKKTPKRKHLPSLSQIKRDMMQATMDANPDIPAAVSRAVMDSLNAAANPKAESPEVVIETLPEDMRQLTIESMRGYKRTLEGVSSRGAMALLTMSEQEWDELLSSNEV